MTVEPPGGVPLTARGLRRSFDDGVAVLDGVDLDVGPGRTLALLGPSGCGKTTLLRVLAGLDVPDEGTVTCGDRVLTGPGTFVAPEERRVGMVFQDWALFPHLTVARNVGFGLERPDRRSSPRIDEALGMVGLPDLGDRLPDTLSGGQQQRVALARAIAPRPSVLLLDEPFSNLDASLRTQVRTDVHALLVELGVTTVFVTHDQDEAFVLGDEVAVMSAGRIVQSGPPEELYLRPVDRWVAGFVGEANLLAGHAHGDRATTALGPLPLDTPATGPVDVLARPESLVLESVGAPAAGAPDAGEGASGEVRLVEYVGRDTGYLVDVAGQVLRVRVPGAPRCARGDAVRVRHIGGPARSFPPTDR